MLTPPAWSRVLLRAHVTVVLAVHAEIASEEPTAQDEADGIRAELTESGAVEELEEWEDALLQRPLVDWTDAEVADTVWRYEGAGVLAWWLGRLDLPAYDTPFDAGDVVRVLTPWTDLQECIAPGRTVEELDALAQHLVELQAEPLEGLALRIAEERWLAVAWLRGEDELWSECALGA